VVATTVLFRSMNTAPDGKPELGESARTLGARREIDIPVDDHDNVVPGVGGMSVSPDEPENLPRHRRPPEYGGTGSDPVWAIDSERLGRTLVFRPDPDDPARHGFVEPEAEMGFDEYLRALAGTRDDWEEPPV
jgi:hypothetical protein